MERFSLARITSDEIQDDELIELGPKNRSPVTSDEMQLDFNNEGTQYNQVVFRSEDKKAQDPKSESKTKTLKRIGSRSKSNLEGTPSKTEDVKKTRSKLRQSFERLRSLTRIRSRNTMKSSEPETNSSKSNLDGKPSETENVKETRSKLRQSFERLRSLTRIRSRNTMKSSKPETNSSSAKPNNVEDYNAEEVSATKELVSSNVQTNARRSIIKIVSNEQTLSDPKKMNVKISDDLKASNDADAISRGKDAQYNDVCIQYKCPLDCKNILKEKEAAEKAAKTPKKKRCYLIRSRTREKIKSKSMSDLSDSQQEKEGKRAKGKGAAKKTESRTKRSKRKASKSPKKGKKTPPSSPKSKSTCYGQAQAQTQTQTPKQQDAPEGKDDKKVKGKKKGKKCYAYRKRPKVDKKPETPPPLIKSPSPMPPPPPLIKSPSLLPPPPPTPPPTPVPTPEPSRSITPQASLIPVEEVAPSSGTSVITVIPSHETFPSSTITIPTISETTIPTEVSHESIIVTDSSKETPDTGPSEIYTPSDEVREEEEIVTPPRKRRSCLMAGPPPFKCNENYNFPEFRERLTFNQNRGAIPPCLQPVLGPCEGRRCTILKGGERSQACGVKYATVKITFFPEYTTYEVMRATEKAPKCLPKCIEEVFVTKYEPKSPSP